RFPEILDALLDLLTGLSATEWDAPTVCSGWSVKDIALHLLGDDVGMLSGRRDAAGGRERITNWPDLVAFINDQNAGWVQATRRISPRLLCDFLRLTGDQVAAYFQSLVPYALGGPVAWAGPAPAPVWLDLAREYTERWHHQQHIRDAVGKPGLKEPRFFAPVLETFVRALPVTYRDATAEEGTVVVVTITGRSGGRWALRRERHAWTLYVAASTRPSAEIVIDEETAWRLFTKGIHREQALSKAELIGDKALA